MEYGNYEKHSAGARNVKARAKRALLLPSSYGGVRRKDFCYDPIPEIWSDIDTQSQNICQILIPNRRSNKSNSTSKG